MRLHRVFAATALIVLAAGLGSAQNVTSARSGTLHFFSGSVSIDDAPLQMKPGYFPQLREGSTLRTQVGKVEILLTPGVFLRLGDNSAVRMEDADLGHTSLEILSGTAMVESDDPQMSVKNAPVTLVYGQTQIRIVKHGLVEIGADAAQVNVFRGEAEVADNSSRVLLKDGHYTRLTGDLRAEKFNNKVSDDLLAWSKDRSQELSTANMFAAGAINTGYGYSSPTRWSGGWFYNPSFGMFTYVPMGGMMYSPFGYGFYSPATIFGDNGITPAVFMAAAHNTGAPSLKSSGLAPVAGPGAGIPPALGNTLRNGAAAVAAQRSSEASMAAARASAPAFQSIHSSAGIPSAGIAAPGSTRATHSGPSHAAATTAK